MEPIRVVKWAFVFSVVIYGAVACTVIGAPKWDAPWLPADQGKQILLYVLLAMAIGSWAGGWMLGRRQEPLIPEQTEAARPNAWLFQRFILAAALLEAGALYGLVYSFLSKDARYGLLFALPSAVLLVLTPTEGASDGPSGPSS